MKKTQQLKALGYTTIPYQAPLDSSVVRVMNGWNAFCEQSLAHKSLFTYSEIGGYEYKGPESLDYKENFHVSLEYLESIANKDSILSGIDKEFFAAANEFLRTCEPLVRSVTDIMDDASGAQIQALAMEDPISNWTLRLLHYPKRKSTEGAFLAAPHPDKAGLTIHLAEDMAGLEVLWNGEWHEAHPAKGEALAYPGILTQYHSEGAITALCHRVRSVPNITECGRHSIVLFVDFGNMVYDKEKFGNTQTQFPNGENYGMPHEELTTYIVDRVHKIP